MGLNGKRVVILGGSSGIGLAVAQAAANEGAKVVVASSNFRSSRSGVVEFAGGLRGPRDEPSEQSRCGCAV